MLRRLLAVLMLMLSSFFFENCRRAQASFGRQMAHVEHYFPHLIIVQNAVPSRHAGRPDAILDDPLQLPIFVFLYLAGREISYRRRHLGSKRDAGILAVKAMTNLAVMLKVFR